MKPRIFAVMAIIAMLVMMFGTVGTVSAQPQATGQETCPNTGGGWVKVDNLHGTSYTYTAPTGKLVAEVCYKASTTVVYYDVTPPASPVTVVSTVTNKKGEIQNLSHASFRLVDKPPSHVYTVETKFNQLCTGWERYYRILDKGVPVGGWVMLENGQFTDRWKIETVQAKSYIVTLPDQTTVTKDFPAITEEGRCQDTHRVESGGGSNCEGWWWWYMIDGVSQINYATGTWSEPYVRESAVIPEFDFPKNAGELYSISKIPAHEITEIAGCVSEHKVTSGVANSCKGWAAWYAIDDGNKVEYATGTWTEPYKIEPADVPEQATPTNPGEIYNITKIEAFTVDEPKRDCLVVIDHSAEIFIEQNCDGWSASIVTEDDRVATATTPTSGSWTDPSILEDAVVSYHVVWPDKHEADFSKKVVESEKCIKEVAIVEVEVECGTQKVGSWMVVNVNSVNATTYIAGKEIRGKMTFVVANQVLEYTAKADDGFLFPDGKSEMEGSVKKLDKCYKNPPKPECPKCGPRIEELALKSDDLVTVEYARGECYVCLDGYWGTKTEGTSLYMRSIHPFYILVSVDPEYLTDEGIEHRVVETGIHKIKLTYIDAKPFEGLDGTYYIIDLEKKYTHDNWVAYDTASGKMYEDAWGKGSSYRSWYISCSRTVGNWDITKAGEFTRQFKGPNHYDYVMYLVQNKYMSYKEAQAWVAEYWKVESGIMLLPPKP